jgi:hypothetical protein
VLAWKRPVGEDVILASQQELRGRRPAAVQHAGHRTHLLTRSRAVRLGEAGAQRGSHHGLVLLGNAGEAVTQAVHPTALPARSRQDAGQRGREALMRIADDELDALHATTHQAA